MNEKFLLLSDEQKSRIHELAHVFLGLPYKYGAEVSQKIPPEEIKKLNIAFDCSELVEYIFAQIGVKVPDGAKYQFTASDFISGEKEAEIGDLVFKRKVLSDIKKIEDGFSDISHVGIVCAVNPLIILEAEGWFGRVIIREMEKFTAMTKNNIYAGLKRFLADKVEKC